MSIAMPENAGDPLEVSPADRLGKLPRELGILLVSVGAVGTLLPGIVGAPAIVAGGLVLWPTAFGRVEGWLRRTCPDIHRQGFNQIGRYLDDMGRRYPWAD
ncbi:hypothetical protein EP7_005105 [Isosphaeraceae bacterium EP7]